MKFLTTLLLISGVAAMPLTNPELAKPTVVELYKRVDPTGVSLKTEDVIIATLFLIYLCCIEMLQERWWQ
jgi:hypothetical protein